MMLRLFVVFPFPLSGMKQFIPVFPKYPFPRKNRISNCEVFDTTIQFYKSTTDIARPCLTHNDYTKYQENKKGKNASIDMLFSKQCTIRSPK